jgi:hypothetical protein
MSNALLSRLFPAGALVIGAAASLGFQTSAEAINTFTGAFAPTQFTLTNINADGSVNTTNAASGTVVLTGGNNNDPSFNPGATTWISNLITPETTVSFSWSFEGDSFLFEDGGDRAGYVINGARTFLAFQDGDLGNIPSLTVPSGQTFGFIVETANNSGTRGVFTVTNFHATPVPLETDALPIVFSAAFLGGGLWLKRRFQGRDKGA